MAIFSLHERLIALQSTEELERKWKKAKGRHSNQFWAAEWLDLAKRHARELWEGIVGRAKVGLRVVSTMKGFVAKVYRERGGKARPPDGIPVEFLMTSSPRSSATSKVLLKTGLKILKGKVAK